MDPVSDNSRSLRDAPAPGLRRCTIMASVVLTNEELEDALRIGLDQTVRDRLRSSDAELIDILDVDLA